MEAAVSVQAPPPSPPVPDRQTRRSGRGRLRRAAPDLAAVAVFLALGVWVCADLWVDVHHRISSHNPNDHVWFQWLLEHAAYSLRHGHNPLFSVRQNAPDGVNIMANTSILGIAIPLAPLTWWLGADVTYAVITGGGLAATATASYWVFSRHLVRSRAAAFAGGAFCGFAPGIVHHANGQPNFVAHFLVPFIVLAVLRLGRPGRVVRSGVVLGLLVTYQVFVNEEILLLTALACAVLIAALAVQHRAQARRVAGTFLGALGIAAALASVLLAYPLWFQFRGPQSYRGLSNVYLNWGEDFAAYVTFARDTIAGNAAVEQTIGRTEQNTWFGWPLVLVVLVGIVLLWRRRAAARTAVVVGAVFAVAAIGARVILNGTWRHIPGPWKLAGGIPMLDLMVPSRFALVTVAAVGVLIALIWQEINDLAAGRGTVHPGDAMHAGDAAHAGDAMHAVHAGTDPGARRLRIFGYAAVGAALLPLVPTPLPAEYLAPVPRFVSEGGWRPYVTEGSTMLPVPVPKNKEGIYTLRWNVVARQEFQVPVGYFIGPDRDGVGSYPPPARPTTTLLNTIARSGRMPGRRDDAIEVTDQMRAAVREDLRYWRTSVVVLGATRFEPQLRLALEQLLGPPRQVQDVRLWDVRALTSR